MAQQLAKKTTTWRRVVVEVLVGAALGFIAWSLTGASVVSWWYEPPSKDAFSCAGTVRSALGEFVKMQLIFAAIGGGVVALIMYVGRRLLARRRAARTTASVSGAPQP